MSKKDFLFLVLVQRSATLLFSIWAVWMRLIYQRVHPFLRMRLIDIPKIAFDAHNLIDISKNASRWGCQDRVWSSGFYWYFQESECTKIKWFQFWTKFKWSRTLPCPRSADLGWKCLRSEGWTETFLWLPICDFLIWNNVYNYQNVFCIIWKWGFVVKYIDSFLEEITGFL